MLLSVIIPTYKRRDALASCLKLLAPGVQTIPGSSFEVVVTDDDLAGDTGEFIAQNFPWVRHVHGPQKGPASNRNNGAKAASGEWFIFLDDDCLPQPGFLAGYAGAIGAHPEYRVFEGCTLAERPQERLDEEAPINDHGGYLWSCNFLINRTIFYEMGGFCELYPYACMEDVDFREQLKSHGNKFMFVPEASVIHPWRGLTPDDRYLKMRVVSHAIFYKRYPTQKPSLFFTLRIVLRLWILFLFLDAPRLKFRGFRRYFARQKVITQYQYQTWAGTGAKAE
jgi:GT2 family glycosyltransferase